mmetsp:Transcript_101041/g.290800  ORF Transcript_101041/g.290800 Transcript_101041/m.290800 type:complete len:1008 (-) Transcript_101041:210-3233(-)
MALPAVLSEKGLAKFRTKLCERLLASGACTFGDKCQYSHAARARRNPKKVSYAPKPCPNPASCAVGDDCPLAHTLEEERYHPLVYKIAMCPGGRDCGGFYCHRAHTNEELRRPPPRSSEAQPSASSAAIGGTGSAGFGASGEMARPPVVEEPPETPPRRTRRRRSAISAESETPAPISPPAVFVPTPAPNVKASEERWWFVGEMRDLKVSFENLPQLGSTDIGAGAALVEGTIRRGVVLTGGTSGAATGGRDGRKELPCLVRVLAVGRGDMEHAAQVVRELKRWMSHCADSANAYMLRRTVATTALALPASISIMSDSVRRWHGPIFELVATFWPLQYLASGWASQLVDSIRVLHLQEIAHSTLSPASAVFGANGTLRVGDFLGKVKTLGLLAAGWTSDEKKEAWLAWYPPEVQRVVEAGGTHAGGQKDDAAQSMGSGHHSVRTSKSAPEAGTSTSKSWGTAFHDWQRIDAWQLGVTIFFLLTGEHPFGDCRSDLSVLCANITSDKRVNNGLLHGMPLFADLVSRLLERRPEKRILPFQAALHPALWSFSDAARFAAQLLSLPWPISPFGEEQPSPKGEPEGQASTTYVGAGAGSPTLESRLTAKVLDWLRHIPALSPFGPVAAPECRTGSAFKRILEDVCGKAVASTTPSAALSAAATAAAAAVAALGSAEETSRGPGPSTNLSASNPPTDPAPSSLARSQQHLRTDQPPHMPSPSPLDLATAAALTTTGRQNCAAAAAAEVVARTARPSSVAASAAAAALAYAPQPPPGLEAEAPWAARGHAAQVVAAATAAAEAAWWWYAQPHTSFGDSFGPLAAGLGTGGAILAPYPQWPVNVEVPAHFVAWSRPSATVSSAAAAVAGAAGMPPGTPTTPWLLPGSGPPWYTPRPWATAPPPLDLSPTHEECAAVASNDTSAVGAATWSGGGAIAVPDFAAVVADAAGAIVAAGPGSGAVLESIDAKLERLLAIFDDEAERTAARRWAATAAAAATQDASGEPLYYPFPPDSA